VLLAFVFAFHLELIASVVSAEDPKPERPEKVEKQVATYTYDPNEVFVVPRYVVYMLGTATTVVWGTLSTVVAKLYYGREDDKKTALAAIDTLRASNQSTLDALKREHQAALDALKRDCHAEIKELRDRLEQEKDERLKEQERLLREQKDVFKEVMATLPSLHHALENNTKALDKLTGG
jgi:hypothetical protein